MLFRNRFKHRLGTYIFYICLQLEQQYSSSFCTKIVRFKMFTFFNLAFPWEKKYHRGSQKYRGSLINSITCSRERGIKRFTWCSSVFSYTRAPQQKRSYFKACGDYTIRSLTWGDLQASGRVYFDSFKSWLDYQRVLENVASVNRTWTREYIPT